MQHKQFMSQTEPLRCGQSGVVQSQSGLSEVKLNTPSWDGEQSPLYCSSSSLRSPGDGPADTAPVAWPQDPGGSSGLS